ncbi:MAG: hypothetical protein IPJ10_02835 [Flavobacteriales bacterium]|nr:hypothetical protein [Flavobacteriales bacterium]
MGFWNRYPNRFTVILGVVALLLFVLEHVNGRFWLNDFRVYYGAGEALLNGEPLYGVAHGLGTGMFKYAPALALFYALFAGCRTVLHCRFDPDVRSASLSWMACDGSIVWYANVG